MRRGRRTDALRRLAQEITVTADDLVVPLFIVAGADQRQSIATMPGVARVSEDVAAQIVETLQVPAVLLFGVVDADDKDTAATAALRSDGVVPSAIRRIKQSRPDLAVMTDVCVCGYTSHGHCGALTDSGEVDSDRTLSLLAEMATLHAQAGADVVSPSAMMDGQVAAIRSVLDSAGMTDVAVMAYAAKFASSFYGPFREAADSAPQFGDRRSYQLPPANAREAVRDALLDEAEGADWLMVKPAGPYLDIVHNLRVASRLPIAAYQVSGEYAMLKLAGQSGAIDERQAILESLTCIKRAGADAIITYYAQEVCQWLAE
ncbi:MAG: porphobilinogen synthase [Planctomycetota bacterium]|jgi:porphobilinogen synthase